MEDLREGGFLITKIRELGQQIFDQLLRDNKIDEITSAQGRVIFPIWRQDNISFQDLKKKTMLSKATLSYMLDKLEEAGYIERIRSKKDKRTITIKLTKKNEALQKQFLQVSNEMKDIYYNGFTEDEIDEFEGYLRRLMDNLTRFSRKGKETKKK